MSDQEQTQGEQQGQKREPVFRRSQKGVTISVWKNETVDGHSFFKTTLQSRYQDKETGEWKNSSSYTKDQLAYVPILINQANFAMFEIERQDRLARERDNDRRMHEDIQNRLQTGLKAQRDQAMMSAADHATQQTHTSAPHQKRTPSHEPEQ